MSSKFVNPNFHPLLVHYPIALLIAGALIEVFSFLGWRASSFRTAGRWMILLGALSSIPAALSGIYALNDVAHIGLPEADGDAPWRTAAAASPLVNNAPAWRMIVLHTWLEGIAAAIVVVTAVSWIACSDLWRRKLHFPLLILLLAGIGLTSAGAWFAGEGVYGHAIGVQKNEGPAPTTAVTSDGHNVRQLIEYYVQPEQAHIIGAGIATALAAVSIGLSVRAITGVAPAVQMHGIAQAFGGSLRDRTDQMEPTDASHSTLSEMEAFSPRVPSSRFWLLAALAALLTATGGWYLLAGSGDASVLAFKDLWELIREPMQNPDAQGNGFWLTRRLAHVICGSAIIVLPLFLAVFARWAPRSKILLSFCTMLLLAAIAGQVWLGVLLIFDGNAGPVMGFSNSISK